jgi:hypothetical protein
MGRADAPVRGASLFAARNRENDRRISLFRTPNRENNRELPCFCAAGLPGSKRYPFIISALGRRCRLPEQGAGRGGAGSRTGRNREWKAGGETARRARGAARNGDGAGNGGRFLGGLFIGTARRGDDAVGQSSRLVGRMTGAAVRYRCRRDRGFRRIVLPTNDYLPRRHCPPRGRDGRPIQRRRGRDWPSAGGWCEAGARDCESGCGGPGARAGGEAPAYAS